MLIEAVLGVATFAFVILSLVALLLVARSKLVNSADVKIIVNGDEANPIITPAGSTLLNTLSAQKIFIPSACGGGGTCGVCKVDIHSGGGAILPTERTHITRGEERNGCRLSCQVKVKSDMHIELEPEIFSVRKWTCKVRSNHNVATFIKDILAELESLSPFFHVFFRDQIDKSAVGYTGYSCSIFGGFATGLWIFGSLQLVEGLRILCGLPIDLTFAQINDHGFDAP